VGRRVQRRKEGGVNIRRALGSVHREQGILMLDRQEALEPQVVASGRKAGVLAGEEAVTTWRNMLQGSLGITIAKRRTCRSRRGKLRIDQGHASVATRERSNKRKKKIENGTRARGQARKKNGREGKSWRHKETGVNIGEGEEEVYGGWTRRVKKRRKE